MGKGKVMVSLDPSTGLMECDESVECPVVDGILGVWGDDLDEFYRMPDFIFDLGIAKGLGPTAFLLLSYLHRRANSKEGSHTYGRCWLTLRQITEETGIATSNMYRYFRELVNNNLIGDKSIRSLKKGCFVHVHEITVLWYLDYLRRRKAKKNNPTSKNPPLVENVKSWIEGSPDPDATVRAFYSDCQAIVAYLEREYRHVLDEPRHKYEQALIDGAQNQKHRATVGKALAIKDHIHHNVFNHFETDEVYAEKGLGYFSKGGREHLYVLFLPDYEVMERDFRLTKRHLRKYLLGFSEIGFIIPLRKWGEGGCMLYGVGYWGDYPTSGTTTYTDGMTGKSRTARVWGPKKHFFYNKTLAKSLQNFTLPR